MRWNDFRRSDNIEDGLGEDGPFTSSGSIGGLSIKGGHLGFGSIILLRSSAGFLGSIRWRFWV